MLDKETISQHVEDYKEKKKLRPENDGSKTKLSDDQSQELIEHVEQTTYISLPLETRPLAKGEHRL